MATVIFDTIVSSPQHFAERIIPSLIDKKLRVPDKLTHILKRSAHTKLNCHVHP